MRISGTIHYSDLEGGHWIIKSQDGSSYIPLDVPEQMKYDGAQVRITATKIEGAFSMMMTGEVIRITSFTTLPL